MNITSMYKLVCKKLGDKVISIICYQLILDSIRGYHLYGSKEYRKHSAWAKRSNAREFMF